MKLSAAVGLTLLALVGFAAEMSAQSAIPEQIRKTVQQTIENYIEEDVRLKKTFFLLDPRNEKPLSLTFDHLHDGVKPKDGGFVVCADFQDAGGTIYDVDVVVDSKGEEVKEVFLHKVDGKAVEIAPAKVDSEK